MEQKHIIIVHGYTGNPEKNWFPWLKNELEQRGHTVTVPALPRSDEPNLNDWVSTLTAVAGDVTPNTYFIGHSLGCITILRYLERLTEDARVGGTVLVAGFTRNLQTHPQLNPFTDQPVNFEKCRSICEHVTAINSDDDPYVPLEDGEIIRDNLNAKLVVYPNGGHLNEKAGLTTFPTALEELLAIIL